MIQILFIIYTLLIGIMLFVLLLKLTTYIDNIEKLNKFIECNKGYMEIRGLYNYNFNNNNKENNIQK